MACSRRGAHPYDRAPRREATALHDQWEAVIDPLSLVWLFFVVSSLQPSVQRQVLAARRRADRVRLSHKRQATVITSIHRQETMSLLGFPVVRYIDIDDAEGVLEAIPETAPGRAIEIILHTPGLALAASQIAQSPRASVMDLSMGRHADHAWPPSASASRQPLRIADEGGQVLALVGIAMRVGAAA